MSNRGYTIIYTSKSLFTLGKIVLIALNHHFITPGGNERNSCANIKSHKDRLEYS